MQSCCASPDDYLILAEGVEAWAFRYMMQRGEHIDRREAAALWWTEEYEPAVRLLRDEDLIPDLARTTPGSPKPRRTCASRPSATGSCARTSWDRARRRARARAIRRRRLARAYPPAP